MRSPSSTSARPTPRRRSEGSTTSAFTSGCTHPANVPSSSATPHSCGSVSANWTSHSPCGDEDPDSSPAAIARWTDAVKAAASLATSPRVTSATAATTARGRRRTAGPSSSYCVGSGADGASSIGSDPDWVLGNAMTSRMFVW